MSSVHPPHKNANPKGDPVLAEILEVQTRLRQVGSFADNLFQQSQHLARVILGEPLTEAQKNEYLTATVEIDKLNAHIYRETAKIQRKLGSLRNYYRYKKKHDEPTEAGRVP